LVLSDYLFISFRTGISLHHLKIIFIRMLSRVAAPIARVPVRFARHGITKSDAWIGYAVPVLMTAFVYLEFAGTLSPHKINARWEHKSVFTKVAAPEADEEEEDEE